ncbi:MAG: metallophosphoesterase family protein [Anaerolineae bacterium]|nr:metallophosphoesterase family protein [Anaerolineae bacterium]
MKLAVISDIHDNVWKLSGVLANIREDGAQTLIVCGDLCAPFTLQTIAEGFTGPIEVVFGNNDGDHFLLTRVAGRHPHVTLHGQYAELKLDGALVAVTHYSEIGRRLTTAGAFAAVFYGHSHRAETVRHGSCLGLNPGEVMGRLGRSSYGWYDTASGEGGIHDLRD